MLSVKGLVSYIYLNYYYKERRLGGNVSRIEYD